MNLACPIDNKDDTIQKVSAVVTGGQTTSLSTGTVGDIAWLLSPPREPVEPVGFGLAWLYLWIVVLFGGMWLGIAVAYIPVTLIMGMKNVLGTAVSGTIVILIFSICFFGSIRFAFRWLIQKDKAKKAEKMPAYLKEKSDWDSAMAKWNRLYYCHKHDIIFDPQTGEYSEPAAIKEFVRKSGGGAQGGLVEPAA